jgi:protein TonB
MMAANGFLEQKPASPTGFGLVLLLHGAAIAGVVLIKGPTWVSAPPKPPQIIYDVPRQREPEPLPPPPEPERQELPTPAPVPFIPQPQIRPPVDRQTITSSQQPTTVWRPDPPVQLADGGNTGTGTGSVPTIPPPTPRIDPPRTPVRTVAQFDPRFARAMQPPYPAVEQRSEREGSVRVRVTIGTDGRVRAVQRLSATSDAFWRATEEQALSRWRFRPATEDGRPVESSKDLTVHFRLDT